MLCFCVWSYADSPESPRVFSYAMEQSPFSVWELVGGDEPVLLQGGGVLELVHGGELLELVLLPSS